MRIVTYDEAAGLYRMSGQKPAGEPTRCPTCGRASDCCCGEDCPFCIEGVPDPERRLARSLHLIDELELGTLGEAPMSPEALTRPNKELSGQAAIGSSTPQQNSQTNLERGESG